MKQTAKERLSVPTTLSKQVRQACSQARAGLRSASCICSDRSLISLDIRRQLPQDAHLAARVGAMNWCPAAFAAALCVWTMSATTGSKYDPSAVVDSGYTASTSHDPVLHRNTPSIWNLNFCAAPRVRVRIQDGHFPAQDPVLRTYRPPV